MAAQDEIALEREQQVLAQRLDPLQPAAVDPRGDPEDGRARMRALRRHDLALEHAQPLGRPVEGVSFGHG